MQNLLLKLITTTFITGAILLISASLTPAQKTDKQLTYRSLFWMDENSGVEVYLLERGTAKTEFNLVVISDKDIKVIYRTSINSRQAVVRELTPVKTDKGRSYYDVRHSFSRTTIWMALDFKFEGQRIESLTRTFYDGFLEIVPNEQFTTGLND